MTTVTDLFAKHHRTCDHELDLASEAVAFSDWERACRHFGRFRAELHKHIELEEGLLFPAFERTMGSAQGPTEVMRGEHVLIRGALDELGASLDAQDGNRYEQAAANFARIMADHNRKEEMVLYPACDRMLGPALQNVLQEARSKLAAAEPPTEDVIVDACWLSPPEPMERAVAALERLRPGQRVRFLIHREPLPLYRMLQQNEYRWRTTTRSDGTYEILIWAD